MTERTSNKQLLDAIEGLPAAIATAIAGGSATPSVAPVATAPSTPPSGGEDIKMDKAYRAHMDLKVQAFATDKGEQTVMYIRKNVRGEHKIAYCLASKWTGLKDRGLVGAVATFDPA